MQKSHGETFQATKVPANALRHCSHLMKRITNADNPLYMGPLLTSEISKQFH